jgi:predicted RNase H-like nuclease (RuvC/YqgF family)
MVASSRQAYGSKEKGQVLMYSGVEYANERVLRELRGRVEELKRENERLGRNLAASELANSRLARELASFKEPSKDKCNVKVHE